MDFDADPNNTLKPFKSSCFFFSMSNVLNFPFIISFYNAIQTLPNMGFEADNKMKFLMKITIFCVENRLYKF